MTTIINCLARHRSLTSKLLNRYKIAGEHIHSSAIAYSKKTPNTLRSWYQNLWAPITTDPPYQHVTQIGDPVLRQKATNVPTESIASKEIKFLVDRMIAVLRKYNCVGLAAPQIGIPLNIIILEVTAKQMKVHSTEAIKTKQMEAIPLTVCGT